MTAQAPTAEQKQDDELKADETLLPPFREKVEAISKDYSADVLSDDDIRRFLVARDNHLKKATAMAQAVLEWRSKFQPQSITPKDFETAHSQGVWRFAGTTKDGCGILHVTAKNWSSFAYSVEEYIQLVAFHVEQALVRNSTTNNGGNQLFIIFDMAQMGYLTDMRKLRQLARILNDYYPERLGHAVFVNCDWVFDKLFHIAIRWVDKRTQSKCIDFRHNGADYLLQYVEADQLTKDLGGTREEEWPLEPLE